MISTLKKIITWRTPPSPIKETNVVEAYDIWAENYDAQPGNLMLDLDQQIFSKLLPNVVIAGKQVADIGCGTGRHWAMLYAENPASLTGFDVSPGMLNKLQIKFPQAHTHVITDDDFLAIAGNSYDVIVSTLTVAHIENIERALQGWSRLLKDKGDIIITDFHPNALAAGGQRTFKHQNGYVAVKNRVHTTENIKAIMQKLGFGVISHEEIKVDDSVKHYYGAQNALHVYEKFKDMPIIYGIHFRRVE